MSAARSSNADRTAPVLQTSMTLWVALLTTALLVVGGVIYALRTPALLRETGARLATVEELGDILEVALESQPFMGQPPPPPERGKPWTQPERKPLVLVAQTLTSSPCVTTTGANAAQCEDGWILQSLDLLSPDELLPPKLRRALPVALHSTRQLPRIESRWVQMVDQSQIEAVFGFGRSTVSPPASAWAPFYEAFPGTAGYVSASDAVISADGREALVLLDRRCGVMCGNGLIYWLHRPDAQWVVLASTMAWVN